MEEIEKKIMELAAQIGAQLKAQHKKIATAESCTGGWLAQAITSVAGSSAWFDRGFITYSNEAKHDMLGVSADLIKKCGAVSEEVVKAMAEGALKNSLADISIAITGIAGPEGGSPEKPIGTVWFAWVEKNADIKTSRQIFQGNRTAIRSQAVSFALGRHLAREV